MTKDASGHHANDLAPFLKTESMLSINRKELQMRSSAMTRRFRAFSAMTLAGASVLVFHSAAFAQQEEHAAPAATATKDAETAKPEAPAEAGAKQQPQDLPPEYAPPPGYRHGPPQPPPGYPPPGYGPYYQEYYGPPAYPPTPPRYYRPRYYQPGPGDRKSVV